MEKEYRQEDPFCVQIELTEGCNLRCSFCGLNGIRGKENNYKFLTLELAERIASSIAEAGWNCRIEFAMHGEPTMNPDFIKIVWIFRKHLPKAYLLMESNGGALVGDPVTQVGRLFQAGLTTLALDEYQNIKLVPKIMEKLRHYYETILQGDWNDPGRKLFGASIWDYPMCGPEGNPHQRKNKRRLVHIHPIDLSTNGTHSTLNNHCGAGGPLDDSQYGKRCAKPFREMSFRWDGRVSVCCNDWRGYLPVGDIGDMTAEEIWHSPVMYSARRKLYHGERDFGPCKGCNAKSYRSGLLPDKLGRIELEEADRLDEEIIREALKMGPMTKPILRPWEKTDES